LAQWRLVEAFLREQHWHWPWGDLKGNARLEISVYLTLFFLLCMVCHGEVVRRKPAASRLTSFYLTVAAGGALGGVFGAGVKVFWPGFDEAATALPFYDTDAISQGIAIALFTGLCLYIWLGANRSSGEAA